MKIKVFFCGILFAFSASLSLAHELPDNRLTLVQRAPNHITMTFYINYIDALHDTLSPQSSEQAFVLTYSSMAPEAFQKELQRAQFKFETGTKIMLESNKPVAISNWVWPDAQRIQSLLQERAMQALVAPGAHNHAVPIELRAEIKTDVTMDAIKLQLPEEFQPVTVVSYRPKQVSLNAKSAPVLIKF